MRQKKFWSRVAIITPGNFISIRVAELDGNYTVVNKDEFINKFFTGQRSIEWAQYHGLEQPEPIVKQKYVKLFSSEGYASHAEFEIEKIGRRQYRINLDKAMLCVEIEHKEEIKL